MLCACASTRAHMHTHGYPCMPIPVSTRVCICLLQYVQCVCRCMCLCLCLCLSLCLSLCLFNPKKRKQQAKGKKRILKPKNKTNLQLYKRNSILHFKYRYERLWQRVTGTCIYSVPRNYLYRYTGSSKCTVEETVVYYSRKNPTDTRRTFSTLKTASLSFSF